MKKFLRVVFLVLILCLIKVEATEISVFQEDGRFGLKNFQAVIVPADYKKLILLGETSFIALKNNKYGVISKNGEIVLDFKYSHANRVLGKFVKLTNHLGVGLYDEYGKVIVPQNYDSIELLPGGMLLVSDNYKYGIMNLNGDTLIENVCDDIYTPQRNVMRIKYKGEWYEIEQVDAKTLMLPEDVKSIDTNSGFRVSKMVTTPVNMSKYTLVASADYLLKIFSSISPAYESTIDELMLSQGAEAVSIIMKVNWLPKFPIYYAKNYYKAFRNPNNGPLIDVKNRVRRSF